MMNEFYVVARVAAQGLLAIAIVFGIALVFEFGNYTL
jgi:hypothetical protein